MAKKKAPTKQAPPAAFVLSGERFDKLKQITSWIDATPAFVDFPDSIWERTWEEQLRLIPQARVLKGWDMVSVQIEDAQTVRAPGHEGRQIGELVALLARKDDEEGIEIAVPITRRTYQKKGAPRA